MPTHKSTQHTNATATPITRNDGRDEGRAIKLFFDVEVPVGDAAVNDLIQLVTVPANCRILGGLFANEAMSTAGGDASIQIGNGTTADKYLGTTSVDAAAGGTRFAHTIALGFGEKVSTAFVLTAKVITEAWLAGKLLKGYIEILIPISS